MTKTTLEKGQAVRRAVLGDAHVDRAEKNTTELDADFQQFITQTAWGSIWAREHLTRNARVNGQPLGERIVVTGQVRDENGHPIPHTLIEVWQANAAVRHRLVSRFSIEVTEPEFALAYVFDIVLRGKTATPVQH